MHHSPNELTLLGIVRETLREIHGTKAGDQATAAIAARMAARNRKHGTVDGWPDLDIATPPPAVPGATGAHIEVKRPNVKPGVGQLQVLDRLKRSGRVVAWVNDVDEGHKQLTAWGYR